MADYMTEMNNGLAVLKEETGGDIFGWLRSLRKTCVSSALPRTAQGARPRAHVGCPRRVRRGVDPEIIERAVARQLARDAERAGLIRPEAIDIFTNTLRVRLPDSPVSWVSAKSRPPNPLWMEVRIDANASTRADRADWPRRGWIDEFTSVTEAREALPEMIEHMSRSAAAFVRTAKVDNPRLHIGRRPARGDRSFVLRQRPRRHG